MITDKDINLKLADLLFPEVNLTIDDLEIKYPPRKLPQGAFVTRLAPSPTGFIHLGNLFGALIDERLAHQSNGIFYLRIEDTDQKRKVDGAVELIISSLSKFGFNFDEGYSLALDDGNGLYGPYIQSERKEIYHIVAKYLVEKGLAYPCFCSEEEIEHTRALQSNANENPGYYGKWAKCRCLSFDEINNNILSGKPYVLRLKSFGNPENVIHANDLVKGDLDIPENNLDIVLLKSDGIPTYHFAHVVDDHFMRTTHVVRGEEWLSTFPWHLQLFEYIGWEPPKFIHTSHMMKLDGDIKRKLSKRKDPEFGMQFYMQKGYPVNAVIEYLLTVLNSNFEEWRIANPDSNYLDFPFSVEKMSSSGSLFDMDKFLDISKNVVAKLSANEVYSQSLEWAEEYDESLFKLMSSDPDYTKAILSIGRGGVKPRKDIAFWSELKEYMGFFFDDLFIPDYSLPERVSENDALMILKEYIYLFNYDDSQDVWFDKLKTLADKFGYAPEMKLYRKNPELFKGNVADVAMIVRIAVTGKQVSPDTYECMRIMGKEKIIDRINRMIFHLNETV